MAVLTDLIGKILKNKRQDNMNGEIACWIDNIFDTNDISYDVVALSFNLYDESDNNWSMELVGTGSFDPEDEDWACDEVTDFGSRENLYVWHMECEWEEAFGYMEKELKQYLILGKYAKLLKSKEAVGVGFVDGDMKILYKR